MLNGC